MLELVGDCFGRKMECVGAGISGGGPPWAHEAGGAPRGSGRALDPRGHMVDPLVCSQCQIFLNILQKIICHFWDIWRPFIFGVFFIARIIQKTDREYYFCFIYST